MYSKSCRVVSFKKILFYFTFSSTDFAAEYLVIKFQLRTEKMRVVRTCFFRETAYEGKIITIKTLVGKVLSSY